MIVDYRIIENYNSETLVREIVELIKYGWQPFGVLIVLVDSSGEIFYIQSMIR